MEKSAVGNVANFIKKIEQEDLKQDFVRFYRGQSNPDWTLSPSLLRSDNKHLKSKEKELIKELEIHYPDSFRGCENLFEELVICQHFGIPTRLLDITSNPLVALFFSVHEKAPKSGNAKVFIIDVPREAIFYYDNKEMLENLRADIDGSQADRWFPIVCVKARLNNPRIIQQNGAFLYFSETHCNNYGIISKPKTIEIAAPHIKNIKKGLSRLCIDNQTMFPDLIQFASSLKNKEINL